MRSRRSALEEVVVSAGVGLNNLVVVTIKEDTDGTTEEDNNHGDEDANDVVDLGS